MNSIRKLRAPRSVSELRGIIATVLIYAPDRFHKIPEIPGLERDSLETDFRLLNEGIEKIFGEGDPLHNDLAGIFEAAYWLYLHGDPQEAADKLMEADNLL